MFALFYLFGLFHCCFDFKELEENLEKAEDEVSKDEKDNKEQGGFEPGSFD